MVVHLGPAYPVGKALRASVFCECAQTGVSVIFSFCVYSHLYVAPIFSWRWLSDGVVGPADTVEVFGYVGIFGPSVEAFVDALTSEVWSQIPADAVEQKKRRCDTPLWFSTHDPHGCRTLGVVRAFTNARTHTHTHTHTQH